MIFKFELDNDNFRTLLNAFTFAEIHLKKFYDDNEMLEKITTLCKIIKNSVWGKVNVKVENEE